MTYTHESFFFTRFDRHQGVGWVGQGALEASNHFLPFFGHRILDWRVTFRSEDARGTPEDEPCGLPDLSWPAPPQVARFYSGVRGVPGQVMP